MPIYEYVCDQCDTQFERIVLNKSEQIAYPKCAGTKNTIQLSVFSAPSANGISARSSSSSIPSAGGGCCGGGCGCH